MISIQELDILLKDIESDRVERTVSMNNTDKFAEAICSFSNDLPNHRKPGFLIIGADDKGSITGLRITDQLLQNLADIRQAGNILPIPTLTVYKLSHTCGEVAVVEVLPSPIPPVRYKGRVHIRIGPRKAIATPEEERLLTEKRESHPHSFDASPAFSAELDAISTAQFYAYREAAVEKSIIEENNRSIEHQLASLGFYDTKVKHPTYAGVIAFGINPRFYLPGNYIQYIRFSGTEMNELPIDQKEISGDLLSVLRELDTLVSVSVNTSLIKITQMQEKQVSDFPIVAIRELLFNAIMHRDYESNAPIRFYWFSDRIEIQNPGGLYGCVELATLGHINDYRNPTIADVMKTLGYVNKFGYGIQRAQAELNKNGNPPAEFDTPANNKIFSAVIRKREI